MSFVAMMIVVRYVVLSFKDENGGEEAVSKV